MKKLEIPRRLWGNGLVTMVARPPHKEVFQVNAKVRRRLRSFDLMKIDPLTVSSSTPTLDALDLMQRNRVGCLPVVDDGELVGILTSYDFLAGAARLFRSHLAASVSLSAKSKAARA